MTFRKKQGFACLSKEDRFKMASLGGMTAQLKGVAHRWTKEEAIRCGRLGGLAKAKNRGKQK